MAAGNPFEILTFIVAPAILTNASSILSLGTSNRFARTVDRSRFLYEKLKEPERLSQHEASMYRKQLPMIGRRSLLLAKAQTWFYVSVGAFAATAFVSLIGAGVSLLHNDNVFGITSIAALLCGVLGVVGLVTGAALLVREMWLALQFLRAEIDLSEGIQIDPIL